MKNSIIYSSPVGAISLTEEGGEITALSFLAGETGGRELLQARPEGTGVLLLAGTQLAEYFSGKRRRFDLPLRPIGTDFQLRVWRALLDIPYGETRSYGEIARLAGSPRAARAAGMANNKNPLPILIPCHRVIGADGGLVGYGGGLEIKKKLLELEGALR